MSFGFVTSKPSYSHTSSAATILAPISHPSLKTTPGVPDRRKLRSVFDQIEQAFAAVNQAVARALNDESMTQSAAQLQPLARHAEASIHRLIELGYNRSTPLTDLLQSATVLILLTDLLAKGLLNSAEVQENRELLLRHVQIAHDCLTQLREAGSVG